MKPKSNVQKEMRRIRRYINAQKRKYGDLLLLSDDTNPESIISKYKTKSVQLKHLQELSTKELQRRIRILDPFTGEITSLSQAQKQTRSQSQKQARKSSERFWSGGEEPVEQDTEDYFPLKEEIELNTMGEAMANMIGETWNYQEFSTANYKALREMIEEELEMKGKQKYGDAYKTTHHQRGALVQGWLDNLVEKVGLANVASMINRFAGENQFNREALFYKEGSNTEFMYRAMDYLEVDDETRKKLYEYLETV